MNQYGSSQHPAFKRRVPHGLCSRESFHVSVLGHNLWSSVAWQAVKVSISNKGLLESTRFPFIVTLQYLKWRFIVRSSDFYLGYCTWTAWPFPFKFYKYVMERIPLSVFNEFELNFDRLYLSLPALLPITLFIVLKKSVAFLLRSVSGLSFKWRTWNGMSQSLCIKSFFMYHDLGNFALSVQSNHWHIFGEFAQCPILHIES